MWATAAKSARMPSCLRFVVGGCAARRVRVSFDFKPEGSSDGGTAAPLQQTHAGWSSAG